MKKTFLLAGALLCLFACKKNSASNNAKTNSLVASIRIQSPVNTSLIIDTIVYDANQNVVRAGIYTGFYNSAGAITVSDTGSFYFTYKGSSRLPASYLMLYSKDIASGSPELQQETNNLFYDSQNRLVRDTLAANQIPANTPPLGTWYTYSGSTIVAAIGDNSNLIDIVDSFYLNNGGNITRGIEYENGGGSGPQATDSFSFSHYSTYANPMYNAAMAMNVGVFLLENLRLDAVSKNLPADNIAKFNTDSQGRVTSTVGADGTTTTYTYNK